MAFTQVSKPEVLRTFDSSTLSGSFQALGAPLLHPAHLIKVTNLSSVTVTISEDGINSHDVAPLNGFTLYDITANTPTQGDNAVFIPQGTQFYVKGTAGVGIIYLTVRYIVQV